MKAGRIKDGGLAGSNAVSRRPGVVGACILFSITIALLIFLGYRIQSRDFYSGILVTEFILILLPALLLVLLSKLNLKYSLRMSIPRIANFPVIFGIMLFAIPLAAVFNLLNLFLVNSIFGKVVIESIPVAQNGTELLVNILLIAGSAGICEEFLFRGVVQGAFERFGAAKAIIIAALLFSFTHLDFQKILGTFMLGALIGYIVYRTDSLYCGMFAHFTNNAAAVFAGYISNKMLHLLQGSQEAVSEAGDLSGVFDAFAGMAPEQLIFVVLTYGFMIIFAAIIFILLLYLLSRLNPSPKTVKPLLKNFAENDFHPEFTGRRLLWLLPGLLAIGLWFYIEACSFADMQNAVTAVFRILIGA